ncbi:MAG: hypothetical protein LDL55_09205 [Armatimonadetes bacterium]|nr:hypothetical protein [Armatimonadota bacterium]
MSAEPSVAQVAIDALVRLLEKHPGAPVRWTRTDSSLEIVPTVEGGFSVSVYDEAGEAMVAANRWHSHYDEPAQAAYCAVWLLTPYYRIVHELKAGVLVAAWLERYGPDGWEPMEPVYFLNPLDKPSWTLQGEERFVRAYHTQRVLPMEEAFRRAVPDAQLDADGMPPNTVLGRFAIEADAAVAPELLDEEAP